MQSKALVWRCNGFWDAVACLLLRPFGTVPYTPSARSPADGEKFWANVEGCHLFEPQRRGFESVHHSPYIVVVLPCIKRWIQFGRPARKAVSMLGCSQAEVRLIRRSDRSSWPLSGYICSCSCDVRWHSLVASSPSFAEEAAPNVKAYTSTPVIVKLWHSLFLTVSSNIFSVQSRRQQSTTCSSRRVETWFSKKIRSSSMENSQPRKMTDCNFWYRWQPRALESTGAAKLLEVEVSG